MSTDEQKETRSVNPARRQDQPDGAEDGEKRQQGAGSEQGKGGHQDQALNPLKSGGIPE
jgi:hypothetical protein